MIVEESRVQALVSLYASVKDMLLQANSLRLLFLGMLLASLCIIAPLFFISTGATRFMLALLAVLISIVLLAAEMVEDRRLLSVTAVMLSLERELKNHVAEYLGARSNNNRTNSHGGAEIPLPMETLSLGRDQNPGLPKVSDGTWLAGVFGVGTYAVTIPMTLVLASSLDGSLLTGGIFFAFLVLLLAFSALLVYVLFSGRKWDMKVKGAGDLEAKNEAAKVGWRATGAILAFLGPAYCYALLQPQVTNAMRDFVDKASKIGSDTWFWVLLAFSAGLVMLVVSMAWRSTSSSPSQPADE